MKIAKDSSCFMSNQQLKNITTDLKNKSNLKQLLTYKPTSNRSALQLSTHLPYQRDIVNG